jgi:predicted RND superfamily exporter protein
LPITAKEYSLISEQNHADERSGNLPVKKPFLTRFVQVVLKFRMPVLLVTFLLLPVCVPGLFRLDVNVKIEDFFVEDDPVLENQKEFCRLFKNNDFIGVLVESDDVFSRESLELIKTVGDRLKESVPFAGDVVSLVELDKKSFGQKRLLFEGSELSSSDEEVEQIRISYSQTPSLNGVLFSNDYRQAWILLQLLAYPSEEAWTGEDDPLFAVGQAAYDTVKSIDPGNSTLTATGVPVYAFRKKAEMMKDLLRVLAIGSIVALILSILIIQSVQGVIGTLMVIFVSVLSVFGIQGWFGASTDSAFLSVPILLTVGVSIGYTVHISRFFTLHFRQTGKRKESIVFAIQASGRPILFTAFTTIVALLSFVFVEIQPIQWVGLTSASCILAVYILTMLLFPVIMYFGRDMEVSLTATSVKPDRFEAVLQLFANWVMKYERLIMILFLIIGSVAVYGIFQLKIDFNAEKMMGTKLQHMKDQIHIGQSEIATSDTLDIVITLPPGRIRHYDILKTLEVLEQEINTLPLVKKTSSLSGIVREFNFIRHNREPGYHNIPEKEADLRGLFFLFERLSLGTLRKWVNGDYSSTRIFVELSEFSSREIETNINKIGLLIKDLFPPGTVFFMSGSTCQMAVMNQYITRGLVRSIFTALLMITVLMIFVFGSVKMGLIAMIPNVFPVIIVGGIMGFAKIPLEFVTMTVAPIIMGLAVDDTIHFISHIKKDLLQTKDYRKSINSSFLTVGTAITETTVILSLSFLVFTVSRVNGIIYMGILTCCGILTAYLADIFVTPILIKWTKPYGAK